MSSKRPCLGLRVQVYLCTWWHEVCHHSKSAAFWFAGDEAEATLDLAEGVWQDLRTSLLGTVGDARGGAEEVGVAGGEAGVAAGGVGQEAEEGAEAEGNKLVCMSYWKCIANSDNQTASEQRNTAQ